MKKIIIPSGKHRAFPRFKLFWKPAMMLVTFQFNNTAKYTNAEWKNRRDWNKLAGFSRGSHLNNSVRLGWRWNIETDKLEICEYYHIGGSIIEHNIKQILPNVKYNMILEIHAGNYPFFGYLLSPYFGGQEKAPHDITISIQHKLIRK